MAQGKQASLAPPPGISAGKGPGQHCHALIRATAIDMAGELYEILMKNNQQYGEWKRMHPELNATQLEIRFLELKWPELVEDARATLARMLGMNYPEDLKARIHDALVKDEPLRRARLARAATDPTRSRLGKVN